MEQDPPPTTDRSLRSRRPQKRFRLAPRWWLPVSLLVSVFVHLLLGIGGQELGLFNTPVDEAPVSDGKPVEVTLGARKGPPRPKAPSNPNPTAESAPAPVEPVAQSTPTPSRPVRVAEAPKPLSSPPPRIADVPESPTTIETPPPPVPLPVTSPQPTPPPRRPLAAHTEPGGRLRDREPIPIARGDLRGDRRITNATPRAVPRTADAPVPTNSTAAAGGGGSGSEPAPRPRKLAMDDSPAAPLPGEGDNTSPGAKGGEGGGAGGGTGEKAGTGAAETAGNGLGIDRGIPFGDRLGLYKGSPKGGGGHMSGIGGSGTFRVNGRPTFTLGGVRQTGGGPPVHIVYVVDTSGSMEEGNKIGKVKEALRKALDELRPEDSFNIIAFADKAHLFSPRMRPATASNVSQGNLNVDLMQANGATDLSDAVAMALSQEEVTHIFIMSDGEPTDGIIDFNDLRAMVRQKNGGKCRILTLAIGRGEQFKGMALLRGIAEDNDGRFDYINLAR